MDTNVLAAAIAGFMLGGLVVSTAAALEDDDDSSGGSSMTTMSAEMTRDLADERGNAYDAAFITAMIEHHEGAVAMAVLSSERAEHPGITRLSAAIIEAQRAEISQMRRWQQRWGYRD